MADTIVPGETTRPLPKTPTWRDRWARKLVLRRLTNLRWGRLEVVETAGRNTFGQATAGQPDVTLTVQSPRFFSAIALRGSLGAAESYFDGAWSCSDLPALIRMMVRNEAVLRQVEGGWARLAAPAARLLHWLRRNTRAGSRSNIAAHYDLGNDFYSLFLDETMTYSSGIFERPDATLAEASVAKYDRICRKLLRPRMHLSGTRHATGSPSMRRRPSSSRKWVPPTRAAPGKNEGGRTPRATGKWALLDGAFRGP